MLSDADLEDHYNPSVRLVELGRPDEGTCGFHLTRSKWDPYPWISRIDAGSAAHAAGLRTGDCLLEVNGEDIIGQRVSEVAQLVRARPNQVSLLLWNAGVDPQCSPEALCCGPMPKNLHRLSNCMSSILGLLECPICLNPTVSPTYQCDNGHLICMRCRTKSERCPVCRIRFSRGRSLLADQVYNTITEAFELREDPHDVRSVKMQHIFKLKGKNKNIPGIKVTYVHTNKFLARLIGKSSSVDNLTSKNVVGHNLTVDGEFTAGLKTKSLSSSEIFNPTGSSISRTGSINGLNRTNLNNTVQNDNRLFSYHGSFESLHHRTTGDPVQTTFTSTTEGTLFYCPFKPDCSTLIRGPDIFHHFQTNHDGPLIQYFKAKTKLSLQSVQDNDTYVFCVEDNLFFLKVNNEKEKHTEKRYKDARIWVWLLGNKKQSADYQLHINLLDKDEDGVLLSVRSAVYSLSSVSWTELKESKKGVYISSETLNAVCTEDTLIEIEIIKCDTQL